MIFAANGICQQVPIKTQLLLAYRFPASFLTGREPVLISDTTKNVLSTAIA